MSASAASRATTSPSPSRAGGTLTAAEWFADPGACVEALFAPGGPVSAALPGYVPEPAQIAMACAFAATLTRGSAAPEGVRHEARPGRTTFLQASTGTGKSLAYGVPLAVHCALTGGRGMIATHTIALQRQWIAKEGPLAAAIALTATGRAPEVALRRSRRHFASPSRLERIAEALRGPGDAEGDGDSGAGDAGARDAALAAAAAMDHLAAWTLRATGDARAVGDAPDGRRAFAGTLDGLVELWREDNRAMSGAIDAVDPERWTLHPADAEEEHVLYDLYRRAAAAADVVIATQAMMVIDLGLNGRLLDAEGEGYCGVVVDEADRLPEVARDLMSARHSVGATALAVQDAIAANAGDGKAPLPHARRALAAVAAGTLTTIEDVVAGLRALGEGRAADAAEHPLLPGDPECAGLAAVGAAIADVLDAVAALAPADRGPLLEAVEALERHATAVGAFLEMVRRDPLTRPAKPVITFSPVRLDPGFSLVPWNQRMLVARLWSGNAPRADSVTMTSATLASPGARPETAFDGIAEELGLSKRRDRVNHDLCGEHAPAVFGSHAYRLADPRAPLHRRDALRPDGTPDPALAYAARAIVEASGLPSARGTCRILVLARSFEAAGVLTSLLAREFGGKDGIEVRGRRTGENLQAALERFAADSRAILVTPGAWEGVDLPGLIDHLVIPRMPFDPPKRSDWTSCAADGAVSSPRGYERMLRRLRQGIGRAVRGRGDAATIWITDPRFGLPEAVTERVLAETGEILLPHPRSRPRTLACVERRFRRALEEARVVELPAGMAPAGDADDGEDGA